jgi:hypothetical protein
LILVVALWAVAWLLMKAWLGFDYARSFAVASALENEGGFLLFSNPRGYLWYRLGGALEIALYLTPFLLWQIGAGPANKNATWLSMATRSPTRRTTSVACT